MIQTEANETALQINQLSSPECVSLNLQKISFQLHPEQNVSEYVYPLFCHYVNQAKLQHYFRNQY